MGDIMNKCCGTCFYSQDPFPNIPLEEDDVLYCNWDQPIPYSWRYAKREVVGVDYNEGTTCPCYKEKQNER